MKESSNLKSSLKGPSPDKLKRISFAGSPAPKEQQQVSSRKPPAQENKKKRASSKESGSQKANGGSSDGAKQGRQQKNQKVELTELEPILFGAKITIVGVSEGTTWMLHSDGFVNSRPYLRNTRGHSKEEDLLANDSSNSIFQILPFSSFSNFQIQGKLAKFLRDFEKTKDDIIDKSLKRLSARKADLENMKQQLWDETTSNRSIFDKMKGTPVYYENTSFLLLHCNSLKFLNVQDNETRKFQYTFSLLFHFFPLVL